MTRFDFELCQQRPLVDATPPVRVCRGPRTQQVAGLEEAACSQVGPPSRRLSSYRS
jgi:hypothetical protein